MEIIILLDNDTKVIHLSRFPTLSPHCWLLQRKVSAESQNNAAETHGL